MTEPSGRRDNVHTSVDKLRGWVGLKARRGAPGGLSSYDDASADLSRRGLERRKGRAVVRSADAMSSAASFMQLT